MFTVSIEDNFSSAHSLRFYKGKCENLHGHNWKIEVFLTGERLDESGVVMDFGDIKTRLRDIIGRLDHQYLNELGMFQGRQPSSERIAAYVAAELQQAIHHPAVRVSRVSAWESEDACATYIVE